MTNATMTTKDERPAAPHPATVCPHCETSYPVPGPDGRPTLDSGGHCPVCSRAVCRRCAGGGCDGGRKVVRS